MKVRKLMLPVAVVAVALLALVGTAGAAHLGNNYADVKGTGDPDAIGHAVVNYSDGTGTFNGTISVRNLDPGQTYRFLVRNAAGAETLVCSGVANKQGTFHCNAQKVVLGGFTTAVVRDSGGQEDATGVFERRGNCREPNQAGSQCTAPGQQ